MKLKKLVASHFANYQEAWQANRLVDMGRIQPLLSDVYALEQTGEAARKIHRNEHEGKLGILCLAPREGLGIADPEKRARIGEDKITLFRGRG
jgi:crotonyl-CoA reductase